MSTNKVIAKLTVIYTFACPDCKESQTDTWQIEPGELTTIECINPQCKALFDVEGEE